MFKGDYSFANINEIFPEYINQSLKEAIDNFGCYRLPARIGELKERGIKFKTYMEEGINRFGTRERHARYTIQRANDGA